MLQTKSEKNKTFIANNINIHKSNISTLQIIIITCVILITLKETPTMQNYFHNYSFLQWLNTPYFNYLMLFSFGYLSSNNCFSWKQYGKIMISFIILNLIISFDNYEDWISNINNFNSTTNQKIIAFLTFFAFSNLRWIIWIILLSSMLVKLLISKQKINMALFTSIVFACFIISLIMNILVLLHYYGFIKAARFSQYFIINNNFNIIIVLLGIWYFFLGLFCHYFISLSWLRRHWWITIISSFIAIVLIISKFFLQIPIYAFDISNFIICPSLLLPLLLVNISTNYFINVIFQYSLIIFFINIAIFIPIETSLGKAIITFIFDDDLFVNARSFILFIITLCEIILNTILLPLIIKWIKYQLYKIKANVNNIKKEIITEIKNDVQEISKSIKE